MGYLENVYKYFRKKVTNGAERHGIIIFDELKLRTGDKFDVRRLTISGLVDFTEFTPAKNRSQYADYGLVFMYHPFMGDWTQTVAMYLSRGPTRSNILSQLLLEVIIALESINPWVRTVKYWYHKLYHVYCILCNLMIFAITAFITIITFSLRFDVCLSLS